MNGPGKAESQGMHLRLGVGVEVQEGPEESPRCSEPPSVHTELTYPWTSVIGRTGEGEGQEQAVLSLDTPPNLGLYPVWVGT